MSRAAALYIISRQVQKLSFRLRAVFGAAANNTLEGVGVSVDQTGQQRAIFEENCVLNVAGGPSQDDSCSVSWNRTIGLKTAALYIKSGSQFGSVLSTQLTDLVVRKAGLPPLLNFRVC